MRRNIIIDKYKHVTFFSGSEKLTSESAICFLFLQKMDSANYRD